MQLSIFSLVFLGVSLALGSPFGPREVSLERGDCPSSWYSFNGRCYKYVATEMTWADAELHCVSQKANLVSIHSLEEHNFVTGLIKRFDTKQPQTWIGITDVHKEKGWMWSDGCPVSFVKWINGQPDNTHGLYEHCGEVFWGGQPLWNDRSCSATSPSVCASRKPVC